MCARAACAHAACFSKPVASVVDIDSLLQTHAQGAEGKKQGTVAEEAGGAEAEEKGSEGVGEPAKKEDGGEAKEAVDGAKPSENKKVHKEHTHKEM